MEKEYIRINRDAYDELANEYEERNYVMQDDFYKKEIFNDLGFANGKKILEIGPGRGAKLKMFCEYNLEVTAIELSSKMSILCSKKAPNAKIFNKNVFDCDFDYQFDFIYMEAVIHNFPLEEAKELLKLIYKWLQDDGILICATTVDTNDYEGYEIKNDYNKKKKRFRHHFTKETFDALFESQKFTIINKKYKRESDEHRDKVWQVIYAQKRI